MAGRWSTFAEFFFLPVSSIACGLAASCGVASGINNAVSRLASLIAVAAFEALLVVIFTHTLDHRLALLNLPSGEAAQIHASRLQLAAITARDTRAVHAITESFIQAYRSVLWIAACSVLAGAFAGWFLIKPASR